MSRYRRYSTIHCSWRSTARRWLSHPVKPFHLFFFEKLLPLPWHGADTPTGENTRYDEWHWPLHSGPVTTMGERKKKGGYCVYHYTLHPSCGGCPVKVKREKVNSLYYVDFMRYYVEERERERENTTRAGSTATKVNELFDNPDEAATGNAAPKSACDCYYPRPGSSSGDFYTIHFRVHISRRAEKYLPQISRSRFCPEPIEHQIMRYYVGTGRLCPAGR